MSSKGSREGFSQELDSHSTGTRRHSRSSSVLDRLLSDLSSDADGSAAGGAASAQATSSSLPITPMLIALSAKASELASASDLHHAEHKAAAAKAETAVIEAKLRSE